MAVVDASLLGKPSGVERHGLSIFGLVTLVTLFAPLTLLGNRGSGIGKRAYRRRIFTLTISLLLMPLMAVNPQQLYAMHTHAELQQAITAAALAQSMSTVSTVYGYDHNGNLTSRTVNGVPDQAYAYDFENHMIKSGPSGLVGDEVTVYTYDADGLRTPKACRTTALPTGGSTGFMYSSCYTLGHGN